MPAWGPTIRYAIKFAPVALEAARQVDRKVRPHLRAYQLARSVDGVVGSWTANDGTHWVVFNDVDGHPLEAFPPLASRELETAAREIDRSTLKPHTELPEHQVRAKLEQAGETTAGLVAKRRRGGDADPEPG
jgi:hypothetical protein